MAEFQEITVATSDITKHHVLDLLKHHSWVSVHAQQFADSVFEELVESAREFGGRLIIRNASMIRPMQRERIAKKGEDAVTFEL